MSRSVSNATTDTEEGTESKLKPVEPGEPVRSPRFVNRARVWKVLQTAIPRFAKERRDSYAKNAEYCRLCILDAFQGRLSNGLANNSKKSWWIYTIFCIQTSELLFNFVMGACMFHSFSLFFEPENACSNSNFYTAIQCAILLIYAFDIGLKMAYEGVQEYFSHDWQQLYAIVVVLMAADLMYNHCTLFANPLRPVVGVLRARKGRRFFEVLKKMMPGMTHSLVPLLFFVVLVMVLSVLIFGDMLREISVPYSTSYNWFFLIFTNDNFGRVLPEVAINKISYLLFFFPCLYVGQRFLLSLIIGDTYETYKGFVKKQLKKEKLKEMQGLTKAFAALDDTKTGSISALQWKECLQKYDPDLSPEAIALYFELIGGGNGVITALQFLSLRSVLNFRLSHQFTQRSVFSAIQKYLYDLPRGIYQSITVPIPSAVVTAAAKLLTVIEGVDMFTRLNNLDIIGLCFGLFDHKINVPLHQVGYRLEFVVSIGLMFNTVYILEFFLRLCANEGKIYKVNAKNNIFSRIFVLGVVGRFILSIADLLYGIDAETLIYVPYFSYLSQFGIKAGKLLLLTRAMRCVRIVNLNKDLRNFSMALFDVLPALFETFTFSFIVTYIFGAMGNVLFGAYMEDWRTPLRAVVKTQQLSFMVDYLSSTEAAMEQVHPAAALFFVFYLILSLAVSNIALSIIIELQNSTLAGKTSKDRDIEKGKLELMFNKIKDQARIRTMLAANGRPLNFSTIVMSQYQSSDTRHFIADMKGEKELRLEDIKQCQKYSNIDLIAHYNMEYRTASELHWEVDFLTGAQEHGVKKRLTFNAGETIIRAGQSAERMYLIISGTVNVSIPGQLGSVGLSTPSFIGQECMYPEGTYEYQCESVDSCTVLEISRTDIMEKLSRSLVGVLTAMSMKSHARMVQMYTDSKRRASRAALSSRSSCALRTTTGEDALTEEGFNGTTGGPDALVPEAVGPASIAVSPRTSPGQGVANDNSSTGIGSGGSSAHPSINNTESWRPIPLSEAVLSGESQVK